MEGNSKKKPAAGPGAQSGPDAGMSRSSDVLPVYLVLTNVSPDEWCAAVDQRRKVIGRSLECDIRVPRQFKQASRRHAEIWEDRHGIKIRDLGSRSGTNINSVWIEKGQEASVVVGDRIWLGGLELEVVSDIPALSKVLAEADLGAGDLPGDSTSIPRRTDPPRVQLALSALSQAELEIVLWMGRGYLKDEEIARVLHRSPNTIRTQVNGIFRKLDLHSRADVLSFLKRQT